MEIYTYRIGVFAPATSASESAPDVTGFDVEALDGSIGKVSEATYDTGASCLVVDTGFWIFGKKRVLPAGVVDRIDEGQQKIYVNRTKDEVKRAPDWDESRWRSDGYRRELGL